MKDFVLFVTIFILGCMMWAGCHQMKYDMCESACRKIGQECASWDQGVLNKFTCRSLNPDPSYHP